MLLESTSAPIVATPDGATVRGLLKAICVPRTRLWYLLFAAVAWAGLDYWIACSLYEPRVPWAIRAIYREEGDTQYVGMVCNLARGVFGEANLLDSFRSGVQGFPLGSLALHSLCVACFGTRGFAVADMLALLGDAAALALFLCVVGVPTGLSRVLAAFTFLGVTATKWSGLQEAALLPAFSPVIGGMRLPRPLVTEGLLLLTLALAFTYLQPARFGRSTARSVGLGVSFGLLTQGDVHAACAVGLVIGAVLGCNLLRARWRAPARRNVGWIALAALATLLPFVWQQLAMHPDIPRRMGVFAVSRWHPPEQLKPWWPRLEQVLVVLALTALLRLGLARRVAIKGTWPALLGLLLMALGFYFSMPVFGWVTGRDVQVYHFPDRFQRATTWVVLAAGALAAAWLTHRPVLALLRRSKRPLAVAIVAEGIAAAGLSAFAFHTLNERTHTITQGPPRAGVTLGAQYKADLVGVTQELQTPRYAALRVLGTFDHPLGVWWTAFQHRFLLVSDPFPSTRSDAEHELRVAYFLHLLGVSQASFEDLIQAPNLQVLWLSSAKYTISPLHSFSGTSDYTEAQAGIIRSGDVMSGWDFGVPRSEVRRLSRLYAQQATAPWRMASADIIVLSRTELERAMAPNTTSFRETFSNSTFKVWVRR